MEEASVRVPLYLDLCTPISRRLCFFFFFEGNVSIMKGRDGNRDYRPVAPDIHKGQHFIPQLFYTPTHQSGRPALYCSIHQHPQTMAFLLCSLGSALVHNSFFFFFQIRKQIFFVLSRIILKSHCGKAFYFFAKTGFFSPKRAQTKSLLVVFNRRAREEFLLQQLSHYSLIFYDKLDLKFFHQTERLVEVKKHLVAL